MLAFFKHRPPKKLEKKLNLWEDFTPNSANSRKKTPKIISQKISN